MRFVKTKNVVRDLLLAALMATVSSVGFGQNQTRGSKSLYDPNFWHDRLKLSTSQQRKINEINATFYEHIKQKMEKQPDSRSTILREELTRRQAEIEKTFHPRQRRKWEKLAGQHI